MYVLYRREYGTFGFEAARPTAEGARIPARP